MQTTTAPHVAVGCSAAKTTRPARPAQLYTGSFHRECARTALALAPPERVWIISALYGLVAYDATVELAPYDAHIADGPGVWRRIRRQVHTLTTPPFDRLDPSSEMVVLAGRRYADALDPAIEHVLRPLDGCSGIGAMRHQLAELRTTPTMDHQLALTV